jgi:tRNA(Met) cytidine acetyltransferase
MTCPTNSELIAQDILALQGTLTASNQRRIVVLSGSLSWAQDCLEQVRSNASGQSLLLVSDQALRINAPHLKANQIKQKLGQETKLLIWNGHAGINPNALGAASGLVEGGGLFLLMLPALDALSSKPDPDYMRMCSFDSDLHRCETHFLKRLCAFLTNHDASVLIQQDVYTKGSLGTACGSDVHQIAPSSKYQDQETAFNAIQRVAEGHRNRPLVITANRGRGKSSLLGIAAARLGRNVIITAPSKAATALAFQHYERTRNKDSIGSLTFMPPEELAATPHTKADLVFVDEAAAIPVVILSKILHAYPRIVFASTVHGYEGTGQGFAIRFGKILSTHRPEWRQVHLDQPIRWSSNDPLEQFIFELLCLNTDLNMPDRHDSMDVRALLPRLRISPVTRQELASDERLLRQVMGLLVIAHYQTSPSDLRMLLDHPDISLLLARDGDTVNGLVLCMNEDLRSHPELHTEIVAGRRRIKGQLIPQSLAYFLGNDQPLKLNYQRIVRIAVHPKFFGQGLGTRLLQACSTQLSTTTDNVIGVSYGFTPELHRFWQRNGFITYRIGYQPDNASGTPSVIALKPQTIDSHSSDEWSHFFNSHFRFGLSRYFRAFDWQLLDSILREGLFNSLSHTTQDLNNVERFITAERSEFDCLESLEAITLKHFSRLRHQPDSARSLVIMRVLQHRSWEKCIKESGYAGKKEALRELRSSLKDLIK